MDVKNTCCFSGHRPQKLPFGWNERHKDCVKLKKRLAAEIEKMRKKGVTTFITGMAQGVDLWCAEIVLEQKRLSPKDAIRLIAFIPYEGQADHWTNDIRERYFNVLAQADETKILYKRYNRNCMFKRNRAMVDASSHLIAVFGGERGGTKHIVNCARQKGLDIVFIHPDFFEK